MAKKPLPPVEVLRQLLRYEPETGKLFWNERPTHMFSTDSTRSQEHISALWNSRYAGKEAFTARATAGHKHSTIFGTLVQAQRVIWAIVHGEWPAFGIDHIDGDPANNRLENLRIATQSQNCANRTSRKGATSKYLGVHRQKKSWIAQIKPIGGKGYYIGSFKTEEEAAMAYNEEARRVHGEFARLNKVPK